MIILTYVPTEFVNNLKLIIDSIFNTLSGIFTSFSTIFGYVSSSVTTIMTYIGGTNYALTMISSVFNVLPGYIVATCTLALALTLGFALILKR